MRQAIFPFSFLFLAMVAIGSPAAAQPKPELATPDKSTSDRADELIRRGNTFAKKDQWAEAAPLFREAWNLKQSYDIGGNLGVAESSLGQWRDAAEHLSFALRTFPANGKPEHRKLLELTLAKARAEVVTVTVRVNIEGAEVRVDAKVVGTSPLADVVFVEPGRRLVEATRSGYVWDHQVIEGVKGGTHEIKLALAPMEVAAPKSSGTVVPSLPLPDEENGRGPIKGLLIGGGVVSGLVLGTGILLTVLSNTKGSDADAMLATLKQSGEPHPCRTHGSDCDSIESALKARDSLANGAMVSFIGAGVLAAGTAAYGLLGSKSNATHASTRLRVFPVVAGGQSGVFVVGAW
jgi:hypothetical protein